jgi:hypothetical protein
VHCNCSDPHTAKNERHTWMREESEQYNNKI